MFAASIAHPKTRDMFISDIATWIDQTVTNMPLTDLYDTISGRYVTRRFFLLYYANVGVVYYQLSRFRLHSETGRRRFLLHPGIRILRL